MKLFSKDIITKNKAFELILFNFWSWKSQITLFDFSLSINYKGDHSPGFYFSFVLFNVQFINIECYDR